MRKRYEPGKNPNSLANLKRTAGPGRPKMTLEEKEIKKAIREYMKEYLESGEAAKDFEWVRKKKPELALEMSLNRIYGRVDRPISDPGTSGNRINLLIQVLTGRILPDNTLLKPSANLIENVNE